MPIILPVTLATAAAAALLNIWLTIRVGQVRGAHKIFLGDEGNDAVLRRMRAHANFAENTPLVLLLIAAIELTGASTQWLWITALLYVLARIGHGFGMDGGRLGTGRMIGSILTLLIQLGLAGWAVSYAYATLG